MFIANEVPMNISQPQRGGMGLRWAIHAAPRGLGMIMVRGGCYNHGAPTELGRTRSALRSQPPLGQKPGRRTPVAQILVTLDGQSPSRHPRLPLISSGHDMVGSPILFNSYLASHRQPSPHQTICQSQFTSIHGLTRMALR